MRRTIPTTRVERGSPRITHMHYQALLQDIQEHLHCDEARAKALVTACVALDLNAFEFIGAIANDVQRGREVTYDDVLQQLKESAAAVGVPIPEHAQLFPPNLANRAQRRKLKQKPKPVKRRPLTVGSRLR